MTIREWLLENDDNFSSASDFLTAHSKNKRLIRLIGKGYKTQIIRDMSLALKKFNSPENVERFPCLHQHVDYYAWEVHAEIEKNKKELEQIEKEEVPIEHPIFPVEPVVVKVSSFDFSAADIRKGISPHADVNPAVLLNMEAYWKTFFMEYVHLHTFLCVSAFKKQRKEACKRILEITVDILPPLYEQYDRYLQTGVYIEIKKTSKYSIDALKLSKRLNTLNNYKSTGKFKDDEAGAESNELEIIQIRELLESITPA